MIKVMNPNSEVRYFSFQSMPKMEACVSFHVFKKGQMIFYQGHFPYGLFILLSGEVEIEYEDGSKFTIRPHALIGYTAFINNDSYIANAKATKNSNIYFLSNVNYNELNNKNDNVSVWIKSFE